ncbi:MAG: CotH kinase family protein [Bacteroidales bacterium]|nr:CotH kinase family protein [Bacteroidales bacterium]
MKSTMCEYSRNSLLALLAVFLLSCSPDSHSWENNSGFMPVMPSEEKEDDADIDDGLRTGLPVLQLRTEGGADIVSKDDYLAAELEISGENQLDNFGPVSCSVRGRGNTTWTWPKKPYLIKLDSKASIFGFPAHKRWVLLANFMDRTLMRNLVSMKVASMTSLAWTPSCRSVELMLNDKHMGTYLLIEQVRVDNDRVDISENGFMLELDFHYDNPIQWKDHGIPFSVKYPDSDEIKPAQVQEIKDYIAAVSNIIYGADFKDPDRGYAKFLDMDSFIDYWIVFEVMGNHELGNPGSVYMYKDVGTKLFAGPCWDFDWGVLSYNTSPHAKGGLVNRYAIWYARLFEDPAFRNKVKARFQELLPQLSTIPDYIEECRTMLRKSAALNFALWNPAEDSSQNGGHIINGDENMSFDAAVSLLKQIYNERLDVILSNL